MKNKPTTRHRVLAAMRLFRRALNRRLFAPLLERGKGASPLPTTKTASVEKRLDTVEQALDKFAVAMGEYARHLASHTSAIQGLAEASHELKESAAEQHRVMVYLTKASGLPGAGREEPATEATKLAPPQETRVAPEKPPRVEKARPDREKLASTRATADHERHKITPGIAWPKHEAVKPAPAAPAPGLTGIKPQEAEKAPRPEREPYPPGCARSHLPRGRKMPPGHPL